MGPISNYQLYDFNAGNANDLNSLQMDPDAETGNIDSFFLEDPPADSGNAQKRGLKRTHAEALRQIETINSIHDELKDLILMQSDLNGIFSMSQVSRYWWNYIQNNPYILNEISKIFNASFETVEDLKVFIGTIAPRIKDVNDLHIQLCPISYIKFSKSAMDKLNAYSQKNNTIEINCKAANEAKELLNSIEFIQFFDNLLFPENDFDEDRDEFISKVNEDLREVLASLALDKCLIDINEFSKILRNWLLSNPNLLEKTTDLVNRIVIPSELRLLKNLKKLDISGIAMPSEIVELVKLKFLNIRNINVFPKQIFELENLRGLSTGISLKLNKKPMLIKYNKLAEVSFVANRIGSHKILCELEYLEELKFSENTITGITHIPKEIENLRNLKYLNIIFNKLDCISKEVCQLTNLVKLDLSYNQITSLPEEIVNLSKLKTLSLENNKIKIIPENLWLLTNLEKLDVSSNNLISISCDLNKLKNLESFRYNNNFNLAFLPPIKVWKSLPNTGIDHYNIPEESDSEYEEFGFDQEKYRSNIQLIKRSDEYLEEDELINDFESKLRKLEAMMINERLNSLIEELLEEDES